MFIIQYLFIFLNNRFSVSSMYFYIELMLKLLLVYYMYIYI